MSLWRGGKEKKNSNTGLLCLASFIWHKHNELFQRQSLIFKMSFPMNIFNWCPRYYSTKDFFSPRGMSSSWLQVRGRHRRAGTLKRGSNEVVKRANFTRSSCHASPWHAADPHLTPRHLQQHAFMAAWSKIALRYVKVSLFTYKILCVQHAGLQGMFFKARFI